MKSLKMNFILNSANQILSIIIPLITTPYISRNLGPQKLGVFGYANSVFYYFTIFAMLGLVNYGGREIAKARDTKEKLSKTFWGIYITQLISSTVMVGIYIIYMFIDQGVMSKIYFLGIIFIFFDINWFFFGLEEFLTILKRNFFVKLFSTILIFLLVKSPKDIYLYALIMVTSSILGNVILWVLVHRRLTYVKPDILEIKKHLISNFMLFLPILLTSVYRVMDKIMLKWMGDFVEVGFYESVDKLGHVPLFLVSALSQIMIPRISYLISGEKEERINRYFYKSIQVISLLSTSITFGLIGVSSEFVPIYFGKGYEKCISLSVIILPSYILTGYASTIRSQLLIPYGKDKEFSLSLFVGAITNVVLNFTLIPVYGALGAAIATSITELIVCMITFVFIRKNIKWNNIIKDNFSFYMSGTVMLLVLFVIRFHIGEIWNLILKICIGAMTYVVTLVVILLIGGKKENVQFIILALQNQK